ncbi:MAG: DUF1232 domain-containing protein [Pseudonocardia sp.]|nr:DUF1232 domain-containing protein [Pseudonocardia sp.]
MEWWWSLLIAVGAGLVVLWIVLLVALWTTQRRISDPTTVREALRLLPDVVRLLRSLAADRGLPHGVRVRLVLLLGYLLFPIDVVPDFIPVLGYADDAIVVVLALRSVVRRAGPAALTRHWSGSPAGLAALNRLAGLPPVP